MTSFELEALMAAVIAAGKRASETEELAWDRDRLASSSISDARVILGMLRNDERAIRTAQRGSP
jgi:hypothetical protein